MTEESLEPVVDVTKETVRGRACPSCGGKIIPSDRAVYQAADASGEVFPLWQCERCGYEELSQKRAAPAKAAHPPRKK